MKKHQVFLTIGLVTLLTGCGQSGITNFENQQGQAQTKPVEQDSKTVENTIPQESAADKQENKQEENESNQNEEKGNESIDNEKKPVKETSQAEPKQVENPESILVLVNKLNLLPKEYAPSDLVKPDVPFYFDEDLPKRYMREEAAMALEKMFEATKTENLNLVAASAYRAYERQKQIYEANVASMGQEAADKVSAFPGASEHQTGLSIDVTSPQMGYGLDETFGDTAEGKWLASNAYKYGFIIRYPQGRTEETGYSYEPWHLRYVGEKAAKEIQQDGLILEEYLQ